MKRIYLLLFLLASPLAAQISNPSVTYVGSAPSGACSQAPPVQVLNSSGAIYTCDNGTWAVQGGGGGSGTVTNIATTGPITGGPITTTGTLACPTCAVGPGSSTANHLAEFSGTDGVTLKDGGAAPAAFTAAGDLSGSATTQTVIGINGTLLSGLATGLLKITTGTGAASIAVAGTDYVVPSGNITGTAGNLSGTPALPNGTSVTTQTQNDNSTKIASTAYTDLAVANAVAGVNPAVAVLAASTANVTGTYSQVGGGIGDTFTVTATGAFTLDGIAINTIGQRVLLKNQSAAAQNGVYTATVVGASLVSPVFTRALDYDTPSDVNNTGAIPVQSGTVNATTSWLLTSQVTSIGSSGSSLTYAQFSVAPSTLAPLASPAFTGNPTAPTQLPGDNSTNIATTAYVSSLASVNLGPTVTWSGCSYSGGVCTVVTPGTAITISNIPAGYVNLIPRGNAHGTSSTDNQGIFLTFNGDTGSNYNQANLYAGQGGAPSKSNSQGNANIQMGSGLPTTTIDGAGYALPWEITIQDYTSTTYYKTIYATNNQNYAAGTTITFWQGVWKNATIAAVTSITFTTTNGNFAAGSTFKIYGTN